MIKRKTKKLKNEQLTVLLSYILYVFLSVLRLRMAATDLYI